MKAAAPTILAIIVIGGLLATALINNINGALLATGLSLIAGIAGYSVGHRKK